MLGYGCYIIMGGILGDSCRKERVEYEPEEWTQKLGQRCSRCNQNISYQKSVSPCRCYLFCHQTCFANSFVKHIKVLNTEVHCRVCQTLLQLALKAEYTYDPNPTLVKVCRVLAAWFLLVGVVLAIVATLQILPGQWAFLAMYIEGILLFAVAFWFVLCCRDVLFRVSIRITEIKSTKLDIQTSAFQDLELDTNNELVSGALKAVTI